LDPQKSFFTIIARFLFVFFCFFALHVGTKSANIEKQRSRVAALDEKGGKNVKPRKQHTNKMRLWGRADAGNGKRR
jgi:hypothetical protein